MSESGLNVVIVGASGGIGGALHKRLLTTRTINSMFVCGRRQPDKFDPESQFLPVDLVDEMSIVNAATTVRQAQVPLDLILVVSGVLHMAGSNFQPEKSLRQLCPDNFLKAMSVNTLGPALVAKHFLPLMRSKSRTIFAALSARVGSISDNRLGGWHSYRASKAALNMLIKNIAIEYRRKFPQAIIVGLHPGTVATDLSKPFQRNVPEKQLFTPDYAATQLLQVLDQLQQDDSGNCFAWDGTRIPA